MSGLPATLERRTRQFEHYLDLMEYRTLRLAEGDCFLVFSAPMPERIARRLGAKTRLVQFAFMEQRFYLDLPDTTLTPEEAELVAARPGYEYALDRPLKTLGERKFDPLQRFFDYGQQRAAAEETAHLFFELWRTPLDEVLEVEASAFDGPLSWEKGLEMA